MTLSRLDVFIFPSGFMFVRVFFETFNLLNYVIESLANEGIARRRAHVFQTRDFPSAYCLLGNAQSKMVGERALLWPVQYTVHVLHVVCSFVYYVTHVPSQRVSQWWRKIRTEGGNNEHSR